jgi:tetratricopeptide (TPR) repeat protein
MIAASRRLLERRMPQYVALYLGLAWGTVQFVNFLEVRYGLTRHLTEIALLGFALLLPSVVLFTYHHGRPGSDEWARTEKVAIPLNVVVAVVILFLVFGNKDLGAVMTNVAVRDEAGNTVTRAVPKASHRTRVALFNLEGAAEDTAVAWLRYGIPVGVATDLSQDMFLDVRPSVYFRERLRQLGYREEVGIPLSLKRNIAEERHLPYFTHGRVARAGDEITVELTLYATARGDAVKQRTFSNSDVFALIDQITVALKEDLELPQTEQVKDLPVAEVLTSSPAAFRSYTDAVCAIALRDDWRQAAQLMEQAIERDATFAAAHVTLHNIYLLSNQSDRSLPPLQRAMDHLYRLPERTQYDVKAEYYFMKQDIEKAYAAAKMKVDLFPDDISGYALLSQFQKLRNDRDGQIASYQQILKLDPAQQEMLRELGSLYEGKGDFENALRSYSQYAERFPARQDAAISLGRLHHVRGQHELARQHYNRALVIAPGDVNALVGLAAVERDAGAFDAAERQLQEALTSARTAEERVPALDGWSAYHEFRGQLRRALEYGEQKLQEAAKFQPPVLVASLELRTVGDYARSGQPEEAKRKLQRAAAQLQAPFNTFASLGEMELQLALERPAEAERAAAAAEQLIQQYGFQNIMPAIVFGRGRIAELRGDCAQAVQRYDEKHRLEPKDVAVHSHAARCYRRLGQPQRAIEYGQRTLAVVPFHGSANYEVGVAYLEAGDRARALNHLRRAVHVWANADPSHRLAAEARAKLQQLERSS